MSPVRLLVVTWASLLGGCGAAHGMPACDPPRGPAPATELHAHVDDCGGAEECVAEAVFTAWFIVVNRSGSPLQLEAQRGEQPVELLVPTVAPCSQEFVYRSIMGGGGSPAPWNVFDRFTARVGDGAGEVAFEGVDEDRWVPADDPDEGPLYVLTVDPGGR